MERAKVAGAARFRLDAGEEQKLRLLTVKRGLQFKGVVVFLKSEESPSAVSKPIVRIKY